MKLINSHHVLGDEGTGFEERGLKGPFECGNCKYFTGKTCKQVDMVKLSTRPRINGEPKVEAEDCCEYVDRVGGPRVKIQVARVAAVHHA